MVLSRLGLGCIFVLYLKSTPPFYFPLFKTTNIPNGLGNRNYLQYNFLY